MNNDFTLVNIIKDELKKKTYNELLSIPNCSLIENRGLSERSTLEYHRSILDNDNLYIELKLIQWDLPEEKKKRDAENEKFLKRVGARPSLEEEQKFKEELEAMELEGLIEKAKPPIPHPDKKYVFSGASFCFDFEKKKNGKVILNDWEESQILEEKIKDTAPWSGKTGLSYEDETQLLRYLRLELGELLVDEDATRAKDLDFLGRYVRHNENYDVPEYHYIWRVCNHDNVYGLFSEECDDRGEIYGSFGMIDEIESILKLGFKLDYKKL